jgi:hemerythrin
MAYMKWGDDLSVGVPMFDREHNGLVKIINRLHRGLVQNADHALLREIGAELVEFTVLHFKHEEMYFHDFPYAGAEAHIAKHAAIKKQIRSYYQLIDAQHRAELGFELLAFVRDWWSHIRDVDREFGSLFSAHHAVSRDGTAVFASSFTSRRSLRR